MNTKHLLENAIKKEIPNFDLNRIKQNRKGNNFYKIIQNKKYTILNKYLNSFYWVLWIISYLLIGFTKLDKTKSKNEAKYNSIIFASTVLSFIVSIITFRYFFINRVKIKLTLNHKLFDGLNMLLLLSSIVYFVCSSLLFSKITKSNGIKLTENITYWINNVTYIVLLIMLYIRNNNNKFN